MESVTRRYLLRAALAVPGLAGLGWAAGHCGQRAGSSDPPRAGPSTGVCARCGRSGHTMLDRSCPTTRERSDGGGPSRLPQGRGRGRGGGGRHAGRVAAMRRGARPRAVEDRRSVVPHHLLPQLHRLVRPLASSATGGSSRSAGRRLPRRGLQPPRLHEGPLVPPAALRRGPDRDAAHPHRQRGSGEFRAASWNEALDRSPTASSGSAERHGWDSIHVFGQVRDRATSRRAPTTAPARCSG